jgi:site-specific DNA recombinase
VSRTSWESLGASLRGYGGSVLSDRLVFASAPRRTTANLDTQLEPHPETAPVVRRIFAEDIAGEGYYAIAEGLTRDGIKSPSAHDPGRNTRRCGVAWAKSAVRAIIINPRYTGRQVWNKQRKDEVLLDVEDVGAGHVTKMPWNEPGSRVWSTEVTHEPLIDLATFERAQQSLRLRAVAGLGS